MFIAYLFYFVHLDFRHCGRLRIGSKNFEVVWCVLWLFEDNRLTPAALFSRVEVPPFVDGASSHFPNDVPMSRR